MKYLLAFALLLPLGLLAQNYTHLKVHNTTVNINKGEAIAGNSFDIELKKGSNDRGNILYAGSDLTIEANFKIVAYNSRRSSTKTGAVKIIANYRTTYQGKKDKRTSENVFYLDDERVFSVNEKFVVKNGLYSQQITLKFNGQLNP